MQTRENLPPLSYATALDGYVMMCFAFIIATLLQFAAVHYFTKLDSGDWGSEPDDEDDECTEDGGSLPNGHNNNATFASVVYQVGQSAMYHVGQPSRTPVVYQHKYGFIYFLYQDTCCVLGRTPVVYRVKIQE